MITFITGLPGHGKTLYTLWTIEKLRKETGRAVYSCAMHPPDAEHPEVWISQIPELTLPWNYLENPREWESCPPNSIVVIDEAQFLFPTRSHKDKAPEFVERLAVHRHSGIDIVLLTQDAMNVDHFVRRLAGRHVHLERKFGTHRSRVFDWPTVQKQGDYFARKQAATSWFKFPKEAFEWYQSTQQDTVKSSFPWVKVGGLASLVVVLIVVVVATIRFVVGWDARSKSHTAMYADAGQTFSVDSLGPPGRRPSADPWQGDSLVPRLEGFAHTAAFYDSLMVPVAFPRISGCSRYDIDGVTTCECTSQQGTILPLSVFQCIQVMRKGWFDFTRENQAPQLRSTVQPLAPGGLGSTPDALLSPAGAGGGGGSR